MGLPYMCTTNKIINMDILQAPTNDDDDDDDDDDDVDDDDDGDDDDDDDDDDDVAIACKESRPQRMLLSSRPYFFYQIGICRKLGVSNP